MRLILAEANSSLEQSLFPELCSFYLAVFVKFVIFKEDLLELK